MDVDLILEEART